MAFKIIFFVAALVACVQARPGGPAAYSIVAPAGDHQSVGNTHEHTVKGPGGASSQSEYSSQVQTAHSQSHVSRSSISNDGLAPAAHHYAAHALPAYPALPALHAPVVKAIAAPALVHTAVHGHGVHYGY